MGHGRGMRSMGVLLVACVVMAACGDSDEAATAAVGTGEIEESTSSTVIDTNTSGVEPMTQTTNAQTTTSATDEESTTSETTVAEPDPDELAELINRQAFTVPQSNTRCGHILEEGGALPSRIDDVAKRYFYLGPCESMDVIGI